MEENVKNVDEQVKETSQQILTDIQNGQKDMLELDDDQRDVLIHDFNEKNAGIAELVTEKPDQDYVDQCKKDFEQYQNEYTTLDYEVTGKDKALEYALWLKDWNQFHAVAPANYWIGVIKFNEVITEIIEKLKENPEDNLSFDYGALTYTYNLMMGPTGVGLEYANWMAENQEIYNDILNKLGEHIDMIALIKKKIGLLQSRWALACNGFKMNLLINDLSDLKNVNVDKL